MHAAQDIDIELTELERDPTDRWLLIEAMSHRILRHGNVDVWRRLFIGSHYKSIQYEAEELTLLAADAALVSADPQESERLLAQLGGEKQPSRRVDMLLSFRDAPAAVRAAVTLQRVSGGHLLRTKVRTCLCNVASFELDGTVRRRVFGHEIDAVEEALSEAARGVVTLSARTYELVGESLSAQLKNAMIATEIDDGTVTRAYIALTPDAAAPLSTFAGLGLS
ncbi:hypothetical protein [Ramlibacter sp.]|uniref:hypothetical protein n=1 Tax=Ramlibacter sp. TaxID=1917967 RepID=UPI002FCA9BA9